VRRTYLLRTRCFPDDVIRGHFKEGARMDIIDTLYDRYKDRKDDRDRPMRGKDRDYNDLFEADGSKRRRPLSLYVPPTRGESKGSMTDGCKPQFLGQAEIDGAGFPILWVSWTSPGGTNKWEVGIITAPRAIACHRIRAPTVSTTATWCYCRLLLVYCLH
jgi:hypothetical protein